MCCVVVEGVQCVCDTSGVCGCGGESNLYMSKLTTDTVELIASSGHC